MTTIVPLTQEEYDTLVSLWAKLKSYAHYGIITDEHYEEGICDVTSAGVTFYNMQPRQYDFGDEIYNWTAPVEDVLNPNEARARIERERARKLRQDVIQRKKWDRQQYERLKAQFESPDA